MPKELRLFRKLFGKPEEKTQDEIRLEESLQKTRNTFFGRVSSIFQANEITDELWDELEEALVMADVGLITSEELVGCHTERVRSMASRRPATHTASSSRRWCACCAPTSRFTSTSRAS